MLRLHAFFCLIWFFSNYSNFTNLFLLWHLHQDSWPGTIFLEAPPGSKPWDLIVLTTYMPTERVIMVSDHGNLARLTFLLNASSWYPTMGSLLLNYKIFLKDCDGLGTVEGISCGFIPSWLLGLLHLFSGVTGRLQRINTFDARYYIIQCLLLYPGGIWVEMAHLSVVLTVWPSVW